VLGADCSYLLPFDPLTGRSQLSFFSSLLGREFRRGYLTPSVYPFQLSLIPRMGWWPATTPREQERFPDGTPYSVMKTIVTSGRSRWSSHEILFYGFWKNMR